uniref:Uncharacterized protein n=1 Tax=Arundo donax TaxID=35708 RepID=A0A0A9B084_ARUDO
MAAAARGRCP